MSKCIYTYACNYFTTEQRRYVHKHSIDVISICMAQRNLESACDTVLLRLIGSTENYTLTVLFIKAEIVQFELGHTHQRQLWILEH